MKTLSDNEYSHIGQKLLEAIGDDNYFCGSIVSSVGNESYRFTAAVIVYRQDDTITDLVPVWWELHWYQDEEEVLADFAFGELKERMNKQKTK